MGEQMARVTAARAIAGALALAAWGFCGTVAVAAGDGASSLPLPRFAALHADKVNLRTGPGQRYPVEWVFIKRDLPVEIIAQFENWRRIRASDGTEGWVQAHMLTGKRQVMIRGEVRALRRGPDLGAALVARAEPGVMARLLECQGGWCRIEASEVKGWVQRADVWGVYPNENVP
jgi:SH3-like domain-containing protein